MPKEEKSFSASKNNKILLQNFIRKVVLEKSDILWPNTVVICSATNEASCSSNLLIDSHALDLLQRNDIEEADSRIIVHISQACTNSRTKILVLSSDTDVFVLLLHY